ncbi:MAG: hypothetical protein SVU32_03080 [Candidatus Nanohaloarchaea archaeon]|nr:hypothetical protein [Candidatus Nanohaloarchaea archaeon]
MTDAYRVTIDEPLQIPAAVYEAAKRARDGDTTIDVVLDYQEDPNAVRGYGEPLAYSDEEVENVVRRPDGGLTWYHSTTVCYMRAEPETNEGVASKRDDWLDEVKGHLDDIIDDDTSIVDDGADIYVGSGEQLAGTSSQHRDGVDVHRCCLYDTDPRDEQLDALLQQDGIEPDTFYDAVTTPETSFDDRLDSLLNPETVEADDFIAEESMEKAEMLQERDHDHIRGSCVLADYGP